MRGLSINAKGLCIHRRKILFLDGKTMGRSLKQLCVSAEANEGDRCFAHFGMFYPN